MDVDAVATRLYRVPPDAFVAERDAAVAQAREAGEKAAATRLSGCRRPTRAAWLTNLLVGAAPDDVEGLLALAPVLADAQRSLDGPALRQVSAHRTKLVGALARRAAGLGREAGQRVDAGLERDVRTVLEAALADPGLAEQVRSGRLVKAERYSGFGPVPSGSGSGGSGTGDPGTGAGDAASDPGPGTAGPDGPDAGADDAGLRERAARQERERRDRERRDQLIAQARERLDGARTAAGEAAADRDDARGRADTAAAARDEARRRVEELTEELERARDTASEADRAARSAERTAAATARRAREADAAVARAEEKLRAARDD